MSGLAAARNGMVEPRGSLFDQVGEFLSRNRLSPEPTHYAFAYHIVAQPDSVVARAVADLTDGGCRLTRRDIEGLGGTVVEGAPAEDAPDDGSPDAEPQRRAEQMAVFAAVVQGLQAETTGFGHDLRQSAAAIGALPADAGIDAVARIVGDMLERVNRAEQRLAEATREVDQLQSELAEASDLARRDPLTGLPNRRAFEEAFATGDRHAQRCMAVFDIDKFKRVNDAFGHAVGDRVLVAVGAALAEALPGHLVARHGGEEFAVLLRDVDLQRAHVLLDDARGMIACKRFRSRETGEPLGEITVSAGVTEVSRRDDVERAFSRADRMLYAAKAAGRNMVLAR